MKPKVEKYLYSVLAGFEYYISTSKKYLEMSSVLIIDILTD